MNDKFKILFIGPYVPSPNQPVDIPLGILYLSSYLKKHLAETIETKLIDLRLENRGKETLKNVLLEFNPHLVGISMLAFEQSFLFEYTDFIKKHAPSCKIIVGGPYATYYYDKVLKDRNIECAVIGEGEKVLLNIVQTYMEARDICNIKGIAYSDNGNIRFNGREEYISDLDSIPFPDYSLLNLERYWGYKPQANVLLAHKKYTNIISSRGCSYKCTYCHDILGKTVRKQSPSRFFDEIKILYDEYGVREFHIFDDVFNIDRKRMHTILNMIIESNMKIKLAFPNALRGDILNEEDIVLLKKAGTYMITFAIESASERIQKMIRKNLNIEKTIKNVEFANKIGLITKGYFMIGFPSETIEEIKSTIELSRKMKLDMAGYFLVVPFYKTELFEKAREIYKDLNEDTYKLDYYSKKTFYKTATGINIANLQRMAYIKFYNPERLLRLFLKAPLKYYLIFRFIDSSLSILRAMF